MTTDTETSAPTRTLPTWGAWIVGTLLAVVIAAPIALSSQDLVRWAGDPAGLGLDGAWPWLAFVALDAAAATCVLMVTLAATRGEGGGIFSLLVWLFAAGSAVANWRHCQTTPARDDGVFFAAMSLAGPLLLEVALSRVRRWTRIDAHTQLAARPRFGRRWLPGVAFRETLAAWRVAIREDIGDPSAAVLRVRQTAALRAMTDTDALVWARVTLAQAGDPDGPIQVRDWLLARGRDIPAITSKEERTAIAGRNGTIDPGAGNRRTGPQSPTSAPQTPDPAPALPGRDSGLAQPPGPARTNGVGHGPRIVDLHTWPTGPDVAQNVGQSLAHDDPLWPTAVRAARSIRSRGETVTKRSMAQELRSMGHTCGGDRASALAQAVRTTANGTAKEATADA